MDKPIADMLSGALPMTRFSMPGHKGKLYRDDITELPGTDNLTSPEGCIALSQALCARENTAAAAMYSVNGSTACMLASLYNYKKKIIAAADCHKSLWAAVEISGAQVVPVPVSLKLGGLLQPVRAIDVAEAIHKNPDTQAVLVTYPNYYGMCCDLRAIAKAAHEAGMILIVDSAHGAHFPYHEALPSHAGECGADVWFVSYHKTLPALNQSAVLFAADNAVAKKLKRALNLFQTTSPSYPIMSSIDEARAYMAESGHARLDELLYNIEKFKNSISDIACAEETDDLTRMVLIFPGAGFAVRDHLLREGVCVECADMNHIVCICTVADEWKDFDDLSKKIRKFAESGGKFDKPSYHELLLKDSCVGSGALIYPPGVMADIDNEQISELRAEGYEIITETGL